MSRISLYLTLVVGFLFGTGSSNVLYNSTLISRIAKLNSLPYEDCGSQYDVLHLSISSCSTIPCQMIRGSTVMVNTIFNDYGSNTQFLKHSVRWIFNAIKTAASISPDPCDGQDACISNDSEGKSYWAAVYVNATLPVMHGTMLWEAGDDYHKNLICFKVPVIITVE